jgi:hypothetical protein
LVENLFGGNQNAFNRFTALSRSNVKVWMLGSQMPTLPSLIVLSYCFGISISDLLFEDLSTKKIPTPTPFVGIIEELGPKLEFKHHNLQKIETTLKEVISSCENPPLTLARVAKQLECSQSYISKKFPELANNIVDRQKRFSTNRKKLRISSLQTLVRSTTIQIFKDGQYPSQRKLMARLGTKISFRDPAAAVAWRETLQTLKLR